MMRAVVPGRDSCRLPVNAAVVARDRVIITGGMHLQHLMSISCNCNYTESVTSLLERWQQYCFTRNQNTIRSSTFGYRASADVSQQLGCICQNDCAKPSFFQLYWTASVNEIISDVQRVSISFHPVPLFACLCFCRCEQCGRQNFLFSR
jgi:hypothetical protein